MALTTVQSQMVKQNSNSDQTVTALGVSALNSNSASNNTAVGYQAGYSNTTGTELTAIGTAAGYSNTGSYNTFSGSYSGYWNTSGASNTALGQGAFQGATGSGTGSFNTALGRQALYSNTTASYNIAVGYQAGYSNTSGQYNVFIGHQAGDAVTVSGANTFIGNNAGGAYNGANANTFNTFIGCDAGQVMTTGTYNCILGSYSGNAGGLDIRTAANYIVLSDGAGNYSAYGTGGAWYKANNTTTWSTVSDARIKENIIPLEGALNKIIALNPVEFDYILNGKHDVSFIAQEYKTIFPEQVREETAISDEIKALTNGEPLLTLDTNLVPYLVKAIQELKAELDTVKTELATLKAQ